MKEFKLSKDEVKNGLERAYVLFGVGAYFAFASLIIMLTAHKTSFYTYYSGDLFSSPTILAAIIMIFVHRKRKWGPAGVAAIIALFVGGTSFSAMDEAPFFTLIVGAAFLIVGLVLIITEYASGKKKDRYSLLITPGSPTVSLDYLAKQYPKKIEDVVKDLQELIANGTYAGAFIDWNGRQLVFPQYGGKAAPPPDPKEQAEEMKEEETAPEEKTAKEVYVDVLQECRSHVTDPDVQKKLGKLEELTEKIYARLAEKPTNQAQTERFLEKYLPLIIKSIDTYDELTEKEIPGKEVKALKAQVEKALDNFIGAFETVLGNLYKEDITDVSTDISALESALAGEGLIDETGKKATPNPARAAADMVEKDTEQ